MHGKNDEAGDSLHWSHYCWRFMSDEELLALRWRKPLKSGLHQTGAITVLKQGDLAS